MLKMQHPDYEVYRTGIHAYRNVACADCHMPYRTEGRREVHRPSPAKPAAEHRQFLRRLPSLERGGDPRPGRRHSGQGPRRPRLGRRRCIAQAHFDIAAAMQAGADDEELTDVRKLVRRAQLRWDYVAANNGMGFHSPQECERISGRGRRPGRPVPGGVCPDPGPARRHGTGRLPGLQHQGEGAGADRAVPSGQDGEMMWPVPEMMDA